jgi:peptide subunit release factor 1 (eRF1)
MQKSTTALETPLREQLDRLAAFEPSDLPVLSLYLDMRPDQQGRERSDVFVRKAFPDRLRTLKGEARKSAERDVERINAYLAEVPPSAHGVAIFACAGRDDFFEAVQLDVPLEQHWLSVGPVPHLYPLARLNDQYPRYAALLVDTNSARIFVFGLGSVRSEERVTNVKTRRSAGGGWSQARYQRRLANFHLHHMKEVVSVLDRIVRDEKLNQVVVGCDEAAKGTLGEHLPKHLAAKVVDTMNLDKRAPEHEVLAATLETLRGKDAETDAGQVQTMLDAWRAGGLGVVGPEQTMKALELGQVEELLVTASPDHLGDTAADDKLSVADELVRRAQQSSARIRFVEDAALLQEVGGVGAILRFTIEGTPDEQAQQGQ